MNDVHTAAASIGITLPAHLPIGKMCRCPTVSRPRSKDGWFINHNGDTITMGNWGSGETATWHSDRVNNFTDENRRKYLDEMRRVHKEIEEQMYQEGIKAIRDKWSKLKYFSEYNHEYFKRKQIEIQGDFKVDYQGACCIPIYNINYELVGYQRIMPDGEKNMSTGSQYRGGFKATGVHLSKAASIYLCEGFATAHSVFKSLCEILDEPFTVLTCFSSGNILNVDRQIKYKYGIIPTYVIADNDTAGKKPLEQLDGFVVGFEPKQDANDIAVEYGQDALTKILKDRLNECAK